MNPNCNYTTTGGCNCGQSQNTCPSAPSCPPPTPCPPPSPNPCPPPCPPGCMPIPPYPPMPPRPPVPPPPRAEEADDVVHIRIVRQAQNVVIRHARLLFRSQVLCEVRDGVAGDLHGGGGPGIAGGELWEHAGSVIHKIGVETGGLDLLLGQVSSQLVNQRADHLQMPQFLCTDVGQQALQLRIGHGVALGKVAQGRAQLAVGTAVLADDHRRQLGVGCGDLHRILQLFLINKHQPFPPNSQGHGSLSQV